jgi:hypothetical protein
MISFVVIEKLGGFQSVRELDKLPFVCSSSTAVYFIQVVLVSFFDG